MGSNWSGGKAVEHDEGAGITPLNPGMLDPEEGLHFQRQKPQCWRYI